MTEERRCSPKVEVQCPFAENWPQYQRQLLDTVGKVDRIDSAMTQIGTYAHHLASLTEMKEKLLDAATGGNHVPLRVFLTVISVLALIIGALLFVLVALLTGEAAGWIGALHR